VLMIALLSLYIALDFKGVYLSPDWVNLPPSYATKSDMMFKLDANTTIAFMQISISNRTQEEINRSLRVTFSSPLSEKAIPAVYCKDLYAEEIAKEQDATDDS